MPRCVHAQARYTVVCSVLQLLNDKSIANNGISMGFKSRFLGLQLVDLQDSASFLSYVVLLTLKAVADSCVAKSVDIS